MPSPVDSEEVFLKALKKSIKRGYPLHYFPGKWNVEGELIPIKSIWHISPPDRKLWKFMSPIQVIWYEFFGGKDEGVVVSVPFAARHIGMPKSLYLKTHHALLGVPGCDGALREEIEQLGWPDTVSS